LLIQLPNSVLRLLSGALAAVKRLGGRVDLVIVLAFGKGLGLGDKTRLIPGHCDPTVNLYDWYVCVRGNRVEQVWPITARGAVY
jgi:D-serine deaminase-like pyridoxal phosphate-dependent protein